MRLRLGGMTVGLAVGVTAAVAVATAAGAYVYSVHHFQSLLASARATAVTQGEMIRVALEHQMIENDRSLIARMIRSFGQEPHVERVMILDRGGRAKFSSVEQETGVELDIRSPTCQACHRLPPEQRASSQVVETGSGTVLRTVIPLRNREPCHRCHDPGHRINGILLVDVDAGEMHAAMNRDLRWMAAGSGGLALLLVAAVAGVIRLVVIRRLDRFETTARAIAGGDLKQRVPATGSDTLSWLGREFNAMADTMTGLLGEVHGQRERLETVINSIDDGIVVLDGGRKIIAANDAFLRRTGQGRTTVLGASCRDGATETCGAGDCPTLACLRSGEPEVRICERRTAEGAIVCEEVHASPIRGPSGDVLQVVEVWRDISKRRAAEARLAESHRLASLGLLASGFSHEMNTPLATILTCVEGILRELQAADGRAAADPQRIRENAGIAREQLLRCRGITQHFLRLSRGQGSPGDLVDLDATLKAVARLVEPTARAHSVTVDVEGAAGGLRVRASEADVQHVLLNLLLNAIQACRQGGRVGLTALEGDPIRIRVTDDGCGIAPEDQKRIFEPFYSVRKGGTGLGLFLSLDFARRWGGDIKVESATGAGSTFEVTFPAAGRAASLGVAKA